MGTAGHIDHGKTMLVRALTGIDCDTHDEEKKRGITIHLGFAHLKLPSGDSIGIVDMPGHKDFIHTMVSGASGIDIALLVISADSGIMPQTKEHLWIMQTLGVSKGLVAMTKIDAVDAETAEIAEEDIRSFTKNTFLDKQPLLRISSVTGQGIDELKNEIMRLVEESQPKKSVGIFRMYPDRIFSIPGFGSVLTGSVIEGKAGKDSRISVIPGGGKEYRIRRMERHGEETEDVFSGDRASINLSGFDRKDFFRGSLLSDRKLSETMMIDARITVFKESRKLSLWSNIIFLLGTHEQQARLHVLSAKALNPGDTGDVQIHLSRSVAARYKDRFVLRNSSDDCTLGGGYILDVAPLHHRRRTPSLIGKLSKIAEGGLPAAVEEEILKRGGAEKLSELSRSMNIHENILLDIRSESKAVSFLPFKNDYIALRREEEISLRKRLPSLIGAFVEKNPLLNRGPSLEEIKNSAYANKSKAFSDLIGVILEEMREKGEIQKKGESWFFAGKSPSLDPKLLKQVEIMDKFLESFGSKVPKYEEISQHAANSKICEKELKLVLNYLVQIKKVYRIEEEYISAMTVEKARKILKDKLKGDKEGITVAGFRDMIGANRKLCLLLFALYDLEGFTFRKGDLRFLKNSG